MDNQELEAIQTDGQPLTDEVTDSEQAADTGTDNELEDLRNEIKTLRAELEEKKAVAERISAQIGELAELFPDVAPNSLPEEVWEEVRNGTSLAAAYALYERRVFMKNKHINEVNEKNARLSSGKAGNSAAKEYFSPGDVRAMSQAEVRANYSKIIESMKKWN